MSYKDDWDTAKKISMSERIGSIKAFKALVATACVHIEQREDIAYVNMFLKYVRFTKVKDPDLTGFVNFLRGFAIPALTILGRQKWYRDTITDLGLGLSGKPRGGQIEDTSKLLEEE